MTSKVEAEAEVVLDDKPKLAKMLEHQPKRLPVHGSSLRRLEFERFGVSVVVLDELARLRLGATASLSTDTRWSESRGYSRAPSNSSWKPALAAVGPARRR